MSSKYSSSYARKRLFQRSSIALGAVALLLAIAAPIAEYTRYSQVVEGTGKVVDLMHVPPSTHTSQGTAYSSKGTHYINTAETTRESWSVTVQGEGDTFTLDVRPDQFYRLERGSDVSYRSVYGKWSGINYINRISSIP